MSQTMPAVFLGHGNPMNALQDNAYTQAWTAFGADIPRPKAILAISAHWYLPATLVTAMDAPRTIHDFGGFPAELDRARYPAPGDPELARRVQALDPLTVGKDLLWGLDHGTWAVLCHVYPQADIPIVQLSIDESQPPAFHYELGRRLAPLRDEGILIVGSGNLVHNLHAYAWGRHAVEPFDWAVRFEDRVRRALREGDDLALIDYEALGSDALLSVPTPEHYLPLLYVLGTRKPGERISFPVEGVDGGSISMLSVRLG
jgi:4,5-DOPA dioxygenase extradiol